MRRVRFKEGEQTKFLKQVRKELEVESWKELAEILEVNRRSLIDWKDEKYTLPEKVFQKCVSLAGEGINIPSEIEKKSRFWYTSKGDSSKGGKAVYEKYGQIGGDPEYRKKKWREWWEKEGKNRQDSLFKRKEIRKPVENLKLAEFVGIVLGDGNITDEQVAVSLHKRKHKDYALSVQKLVKNLFQIEAPIYSYNSPGDKNKISVTISSRNLVEFLLARGLEKGNKVEQQVSVPNWVENKIEFSKSCLKGLIDTDGCVYSHRHRSHGNEHYNIGMAFSNKSLPLLSFVKGLLSSLGFNPKYSSQESDIFLYRQQEVYQYAQKIGFRNSYHSQRLKRFRKKKEEF